MNPHRQEAVVCSYPKEEDVKGGDDIALMLDDVWYRYPGENRYALAGASLSVKRGEAVALIGPNGAGKSTLLLHLNGILRPGQGRVHVMGRPVDKDVCWARSKVGLVFQNPDDQLFCPTVEEDVAFGPLNMGLPREEVRRRVAEALDRVGLGDREFQKRHPHHLSHGERQRAAIAGVLAMQPEVLALDEPTSNLDPSARERLMDLLWELPQTKLIATHDMEFAAETCERAVLLVGGRVVSSGSIHDVLSDVQLLRTYGLKEPLLVRLFSEVGMKPPLRLDEAIELLRGMKGR